MRYGIIGTGAIGGYYGAKLAHAGQEVHFLLHSDYEYVKQHGLQVDSCDGSFHLDDVNAYGQTKDMPTCDVVLVGLKSVNNDKLPALLPPLLHDKATNKREQSDARIDSAKREQARPTVKTRDAQRTMMRRLLTFFKNKGFKGGQFNLDGTEPTGNYTEGMAGANAVGAFALADSDNEEDRALAREYVQRLWDVQPPTGKWRYYVGMVYFLSMLHVSGHFGLS